MVNYNGFISDKSRKDFQNIKIEGEIIHLFEHTVNLVLNNQFPHLLTIGTPLISGSPSSLAFPEFETFRGKLQIGDRFVLLDGQKLRGKNFEGQLTITAEEKRVQQEETVERFRLEYLRKRIEQQSMLETYSSAQPFYQQLFREIPPFKDHFQTHDMKGMDLSIQRLIGLGVGLTPSGDDFLTGVLLVLNGHRQNERALRKLVAKEWHQTNIISQHQLYYASHGRGKRSLLRVINGMTSQKIGRLEYEQAVEETFAVGSTSGHDLLLGVLAGFDLMNEKGEEKK